MPTDTTHLTPTRGELLAWHRKADIQAVKLPNGDEALFIDGNRVNIENGSWATQTVINLCRLGPLDLAVAKQRLLK
jgi:hypothetical protein